MYLYIILRLVYQKDNKYQNYRCKTSIIDNFLLKGDNSIN